jgi:hypothetical protein
MLDWGFGLYTEMMKEVDTCSKHEIKDTAQEQGHTCRQVLFG